MKKISILIPTYNEENNIGDFITEIKKLFSTSLINYEREIVIIDNYSTDNTRKIIDDLCSKDKTIKAIYNIRNFGSIRSGFYGLKQTSGDCVVKIAADFQEPIEVIPEMVKKWEEGYGIVVGVKHKSKENKLKFALRSLYYSIIKKMSDIEQIEHFTGFGLYDKKFIDFCKELNDPYPYFRGIVSEFGGKYAEVEYVQAKRKSGKSKYNFFALYDYGMLGITSYTKMLLRLATFIGFIVAGLCMVIGIIFLIYKLLYWDSFATGVAPLLIGLFFLNALQMIFIGILGEYVLNINTRVLNRPLVAEEKRINF